jgi:prepilin-type N-terminal cleavage/methylation domain-containing protein
MKHGFSLVETLIAIVIMALVLGIGIPSLGPALDRIAVDQAASRLVAAHTRARILSITEGRVALLSIQPDSLTISIVAAPDTLPVWSEAGPASDGVAVSGPSRVLVFAPVGITMGLSNGTWLLTRSASSRQVVVSRYGRVQVR